MIGTIKTEEGLLFQKEPYAVVKKVGKAGEKIAKHNHPHEMVIITVVKGKVQITFNDKEVHEAGPGTVIEFDGTNYVAPKFLEDGEFVVTLIVKPECLQNTHA